MNINPGVGDMIKKIDHIGIAVKSLSNALSLYKDTLGLELKGIEEIEEQKVRVAIIPIGDSKIELIEPMGDDSPIKRFIDNRGEGIHHIALETDNIVHMLKSLKEKGYKLVDEEPRVGASKAKIAFIHPKSTMGTLIELCEH
ncbi:MAG: methylmalonyl-CoA epimerase [Nitrososphaerales archaeon]|nr:methylmalonyl-CoA epimerase [Nitrososphaerales archaeon]